MKFPRILHWMDVKVGDHVIRRSLKDNVVCFDFVYILSFEYCVICS